MKSLLLFVCVLSSICAFYWGLGLVLGSGEYAIYGDRLKESVDVVEDRYGYALEPTGEHYRLGKGLEKAFQEFLIFLGVAVGSGLLAKCCGPPRGVERPK